MQFGDYDNFNCTLTHFFQLIKELKWFDKQKFFAIKSLFNYNFFWPYDSFVTFTCWIIFDPIIGAMIWPNPLIVNASPDRDEAYLEQFKKI